MEASYKFFENRKCAYFPCHAGTGDFNCLFCYCPLYSRADCPGNPEFIESNGKKIKTCTNCTFPHQPQNYDLIMKILSQQDKMEPANR